MTPSKQRGAPEDDPTQVTVNPEPMPRDSEELTAKTVPPSLTAHTPIPGASTQLPDRDPDLEPGTTLNEYTIEGKIGVGGMGSVFSAVHPLIGKRAAIKVLRKELCEDPISLERFIDEARVVNEIGHPNIVDVFAFGTLPDGRSYFVMEWLKGESLRERVARGKLNHLEACAILKALARALEAAHEKGIIHRDLKPDNVFLVEERGDIPRVKLLDFGIAKLTRAEQSVSRTATGAMIGTPQYVAPEQAKGHPIDHRVDIYSLGCVAFELLTGRPPFVADNAMEMVAKHLMEAPHRPSTLEPTVPKDLDQIVVEMLAKDREQRPTLTEISAVFERVSRAPIPRSSEPALDRLGDALSLAVTRPHDIGEILDKETKRRRRSKVWSWLGVIAGGVTCGALTFMVVSALKDPKDSKDLKAAPAPAPAIVPTTPEIEKPPAPELAPPPAPSAPADAPAPTPTPEPAKPAPVREHHATPTPAKPTVRKPTGSTPRPGAGSALRVPDGDDLMGVPTRKPSLMSPESER